MASRSQLNAAVPAEAGRLLDGIYEHSPWIAQARCRAPLPLARAPEARLVRHWPRPTDEQLA
jgi:2-oxo-4-hydroxy-4-carboxy--5-ureidoimidazoline (OHCU) decarboxylase